MIRKPKHVTIVVLSEEEAKELSVRHSLRCIGRDCRFLCRALAGHWRRYSRSFDRGWTYTNNWWTWRGG